MITRGAVGPGAVECGEGVLRCGKAEPRPRPGGPGRPGEDLGLLAEPLPAYRRWCLGCVAGLAWLG